MSDGPLRNLIAASFAVAIFMPYVVEQVLPMRAAVIGLGVVSLLLESRGLADPWRQRMSAAVLLGIGGAASLGVLLAGNVAPLVMVNFQRFVIEAPVFVSLGVVLVATGGFRRYSTALWGVGLVAATGVIVESRLGRSVMGRDVEFAFLARDGAVRGLFASEQPLVLGAMLAIAIPLCWTSGVRPRTRLLIQIVLVYGTYCTGSRGPFALSVALVLIGSFVPLRASIASHARLLSWVSVAFATVALWLSTRIYGTTVTGLTGGEYSTNYRKALYALLPDILESHPRGVGWGELPAGVLLVQSELLGVRDVTETIDSEVVYLALTFGWIGLVLYLSLIWLAIRAFRADFCIATAAVAALVVGTILALHAWDTLGSLWFLLIGAALSGAVGREPDGVEPGNDARLNLPASARTGSRA